MREYLVPTNDTVAASTLRRLEINYIRWHMGQIEDQGFGQTMKDLNTGQFINPKNKTDDELVDDYQPAMPGVRRGQLNLEDGFTNDWAGEAIRRATDDKLVIPLPPEGGLRDALLFSVPQPMNIETGQDDWFPAETPED